MDNTLIYGLATLGVGFLGVVVRYGFKSKCSDVSICCGLLSVKRDIEAEVKEDIKEMELGHREEMKSI